MRKSFFRRCLHPFDRGNDLLCYTRRRADLLRQLCHDGCCAEQFLRSSYMSRMYTLQWTSLGCMGAVTSDHTERAPMDPLAAIVELCCVCPPRLARQQLITYAITQ